MDWENFDSQIEGDFDFLAQATMELSGAMSHQNPSLINAVEGSGVVFHIEKGRSTFCLRGRAVEDLKAPDPDDTQKWLKLPTPTLPLAELVTDQMMNRRFPYEDGLIAGLATTDGSWWIETTENKIKIQWKNHSPSSLASRIGPISYPKIASFRFQRICARLTTLFAGLSACEATDRWIELTFHPDQLENFHLIRNLFLEGIPVQWNSAQTLEEQTFLQYLTELALCRKLWINTEEKLSIIPAKLYQ